MHPNTTGLIANREDLEIIWRPIAELQPDPANPRQHSKKQIKQIAKSIKAFGFNVPVLVDAEFKVLAGHGRVLACREAGIEEVPTVCLEHLTPAQARAFTIADNKLAENATWDDRLLAEQLRDLSLSDLDFDIEDIGFEMGEIDMRIESLEDPLAANKTDPADVLAEIAAGPPVSISALRWARSIRGSSRSKIRLPRIVGSLDRETPRSGNGHLQPYAGSGGGRRDGRSAGVVGALWSVKHRMHRRKSGERYGRNRRRRAGYCHRRWDRGRWLARDRAPARSSVVRFPTSGFRGQGSQQSAASGS